MEIFKFTHLIEEAKSKYASNLKVLAATHDIIDSIDSFHQIAFNYLTVPPVKIKTKPVLFILKRRDNYKEVLAMKGTTLEKNPSAYVVQDMPDSESAELPAEEFIEKSKETKQVIEIEPQTIEAVESIENSFETPLVFPDLSVEEPELTLDDIPDESRGTSESEIDFQPVQIQEKENIVITRRKKIKKAKSVITEIPITENVDDQLSEEEIPQKETIEFKLRSKKPKRTKVKELSEESQLTLPPPTSIQDSSEHNNLRPPKSKLKKIAAPDDETNTETSPKRHKTIKRAEEEQAREEEQPLESETNHLRVKQNIKKIIQKYRRKKINEEQSVETQKKSSQDEPVQIYEEISKIEKQIIEIIDNNPIIINKDYVKTRLSETIKLELVNAMDPTAIAMIQREELRFDKGNTFSVLWMFFSVFLFSRKSRNIREFGCYVRSSR